MKYKKFEALFVSSLVFFKLYCNLKKVILVLLFIIWAFFLEIIDKNSSVKVSGILYKSIGLYDCKYPKTKDWNFIVSVNSSKKIISSYV